MVVDLEDLFLLVLIGGGFGAVLLLWWLVEVLP